MLFIHRKLPVSKSLIKAISTTVITLSFFFIALAAHAESLEQLFNSPSSSSGQAFIPVEEAFKISAEINNSKADIHFAITPGHYLYKKRFKFSVEASNTQLGAPLYPLGIEKYDENFSEVLEVFDRDINIQIPITSHQDIPEIQITFQGCAEAGLCYPPHTQTIALLSPDNSLTSGSTTITTNTIQNTNTYKDNILEKGLLTSLLLFLLAGIGLTFTPCVLPMIPILSSILIGNAQTSKSKIISLTLTYILSMSLTFAAAGTLMGLFGASLNIQAKLQSPWLIVPFALIFVLLSLSMFGLYELQLPEKLRNRFNNTQSSQGSLSGALLMGILSALVVSPCVSAPLAGALIYIGATGDALLGGLSLFALGLGMGLPLLLIGIGGRHLLPKAGLWMDSVKIFFGFLLLAVAIWMLERIIPGSITLLLWGSLLIAAGIKLGALHFQSRQGWQIATQALGWVLLIYGGCLIVGAAKGNTDPLKPLANPLNPNHSVTTGNAYFTKINSIPELNQLLNAAKKQQKPVMIDVYADWCLSCKIMERTVFPAPDVQPLLSAFQLIKLDTTDNTREHQAWLDSYQLFGPPALLFFDGNGQELSHIRSIGEINAETLITKLEQVKPTQ
ncbi:hypothetical protein ACH42_10660 [Endozoicomonas sp. (ex Bugula neritina AB1)]|nr:hypothetical protein ACH42_10660 [Endozoicomonas sp. (ex Bugula neritina AB1)]